MSGFSVTTSVDNSQDVDVHTTSGWTDMVCQLRSTAGGENKVGFDNGASFLAEPGSVYRIMVAPNTKIIISSSSASPVQWSFMFQDAHYIAQSVAMLDSINQILQQLGLLFLPPEEELPEFDREDRAALLDKQLILDILHGRTGPVRVLAATHRFRR